MSSSNTVARNPETPPPGQEAVFGNKLLIQTLLRPLTVHRALTPRHICQETLPASVSSSIPTG